MKCISIGIGIEADQVVHVGHREPAKHQSLRFHEHLHRWTLPTLQRYPAGHTPAPHHFAHSTVRTAPGHAPWPHYRNLAVGALHLAGRQDTTEATRWASRSMDRPFTILGLSAGSRRGTS